jgi:splicing factor 3A subunit 3
LAEEGSDEEAPIYNPLKLPLGWDGRPIPFWLYRLHGLNIEFKCEICGGASYWGRRAFERHFKEAQHQQGLRALGIPWSREFYEVTSIADALGLWKAVRERRTAVVAPGGEEEFEDEAGNVYNKKTWLDLKRQGLV